MRQLVKKKENSEFKPVKFRLKFDLVSYPVRAEGLVSMINIKAFKWNFSSLCLNSLYVSFFCFCFFVLSVFIHTGDCRFRIDSISELSTISLTYIFFSFIFPLFVDSFTPLYSYSSLSYSLFYHSYRASLTVSARKFDPYYVLTNSGLVPNSYLFLRVSRHDVIVNGLSLSIKTLVRSEINVHSAMVPMA